MYLPRRCGQAQLGRRRRSARLRDAQRPTQGLAQLQIRCTRAAVTGGSAKPRRLISTSGSSGMGARMVWGFASRPQSAATMPYPHQDPSPPLCLHWPAQSGLPLLRPPRHRQRRRRSMRPLFYQPADCVSWSCSSAEMIGTAYQVPAGCRPAHRRRGACTAASSAVALQARAGSEAYAAARSLGGSRRWQSGGAAACGATGRGARPA